MPKHIYGSLGLLQNDVPDERFVDAILRLHIQEKDLAIDRVEALQRNLHGATDLASDCLLGCRLAVDVSDGHQPPEAILLNTGQNHMSGPGVDKSITVQNMSLFEQILDPYLDGYASHLRPLLLYSHNRTLSLGLQAEAQRPPRQHSPVHLRIATPDMEYRIPWKHPVGNP